MKPNRNPAISVHDIGGELVLYKKEGEAIHVLNQTARVIWELADGLHTIDEMDQTLHDRFSIPDNHDVLGDIQRTLDIFQKKGLLQSEIELARD